MPRPQKLFGAKSAKAYAGSGGLTQHFAVKPKPPPPGRGCGCRSKKRKTQHALCDGLAHNAPVNNFEGEEQQAPPPVANVSFQIKKTRINWGKEKHRDLMGRAIQDWRERMAVSTSTTSRGVVNVTNSLTIMEFPPQTFYKYIKPTNPRILGV